MPDKIYEYEGWPEWIEKDWEKWYDLAQSYKRAYTILIDNEYQETDIYSERDIFPILFLIRQYVELVMKLLLLLEGERVPPHHILDALLVRVLQIHKDLKLSETSKGYIKHINSLDRKGDAFRYPVNKQNSEFFPTHTNNKKNLKLRSIKVNIEALSDELERYTNTLIKKRQT